MKQLSSKKERIELISNLIHQAGTQILEQAETPEEFDHMIYMFISSLLRFVERQRDYEAADDILNTVAVALPYLRSSEAG